MNLEQFQIGATYQVTKTDFDAPDGSGNVPGKAFIATILPPEDAGTATVFDGESCTPATPLEIAERAQFLRVQREDGRIHLLHPEFVASATRLAYRGG